MPRDCLSGPEEAIDVWPRSGCWLQVEACQVSVLRVSQSIGGGLPSQRFKGFKVFKAHKRLEGLEGLEGLRAGKRQALDAHKKPLMCGLGVLLAAG